MGHYDNCRPGNCGACGQAEGYCEHTKEKKVEDITAVTLKTLIPKIKETDTPENILARRYRYLTKNPTGAEHLFKLLNQKKGTVEDFHTMLDRIIASAMKAGVFE